MNAEGSPCTCRWDEDVNPPKQLSVCRFHEDMQRRLELLTELWEHRDDPDRVMEIELELEEMDE